MQWSCGEHFATLHKLLGECDVLEQNDIGTTPYTPTHHQHKSAAKGHNKSIIDQNNRCSYVYSYLTN